MASARLIAPAACSAADLQTDRTASFRHVPLFPAKALWPGWTGRVAPAHTQCAPPENGPLCSQSRRQAL